MTEYNTPRPDSRFVLKYEGAEREIFMSYGLLNELVGLVQNLDGAPMMIADHAIRDEALEILLIERDSRGRPTGEKIDPFYIGADSDDLLALLTWGVEHVFHFFITSLENVARTARSFEERSRNLMSQPGGSST